MTRRSAPPATFLPQLATLVKAPPSGPGWVHEIKYDGYRIGCRLERGAVTLLSRHNNDWTSNFPEIAEAVARLPVTSAFLDGEVAIQGPDGRTSFQALQNASSGASRAGLVYFVFDLLHLDGQDLSGEPLQVRKSRLAQLLARKRSSDRLRFSDHLEGEAATVLAEACRLGLEGIVSKRRDEAYRPGRNDGWLKSKCVNRQEFVVGGFTEPQGKREGIGALLVGYYDAGRLVFAGKVGTGFSDRVARELRARLDAIEQPAAPFDLLPRGWLGKHARWVRPDLVAEVAFTEWTGDGRIRHPSFQGLRTDKRPREIGRERPAEAGTHVRNLHGRAEAAGRRSAAVARPGEAGPHVRNLHGRAEAAGKRSAAVARPAEAGPHVRNLHGRAEAAGRRSAAVARPAEAGPHVRNLRAEEVAGVRLTHPDRVLFPEGPITKLDLARFYERIADWIVPHLRGRPLTLVRCPEGSTAECFYMKHSKVWAPEPLRRVDIREKKKVGEYLIADDLPALVGLVQMGVLEIHTWNSTIDDVERPDRVVMDIDPGPEVAFSHVIETARLVRAVLQRVGLDSFVKSTGGSGLHVVVPLERAADWSECLAFARAVAEAIVRADPSRYTTTFAKAGRARKLLIDYLRNNRTNTSVAAFSTRAKPGAPVSVPLRWEELTPRLRPNQFTVANVERRLSALREDPWKDYWTLRQRITASALKAVAEVSP